MKSDHASHQINGSEGKKITAELGKRIAQIAEKVGGKRALADVAGVSEGQIYRYIEGKNVPGIDIIVKIAKALSVSVEWLATGEEPSQSKEGSAIPLPGFPTSSLHTQLQLNSYKPLTWQVVEGDSMEPTLRAGDILLIEPLLDGEESVIIQDGIYAIELEGIELVRRLQRLPGGTIKVINDNQAYEAFLIDLGNSSTSLNIRGKVARIIRVLQP
jgi:phage repressor protein C with HTH and peptisase S24 domain